MIKKSDLFIHSTLWHIAHLARTSLIVEGDDWRIKREEALIEIRDIVEGILGQEATYPDPLQDMIEKGLGEWVKEEAPVKVLWIAVYTHRFGNDVIPYFRTLDQPLTEEEVIENLDDWEGDTREDEHIDIAGPYPYTEEN